MPNILVVIQDYPSFSEQCEEISESLPSMTRECAKYGVYFLLTCNSAMGIRYKLQQNFSQMFVLQLNDKSDYMGILGNTGVCIRRRLREEGLSGTIRPCMSFRRSRSVKTRTRRRIW